MATTDAEDLAQRVAQQLAAVVIAALRPDTPPTGVAPTPTVVGAAVDRLGGELVMLLRDLEPRPARPDDTMPGVRRTDSAVARAANLAAHIMLSGNPDGSDDPA
ncbi:hypothetical protein B1813_05250 [Saccharomonospora piscinae]|uniref:Uncharacterized protein n=1 Tax=Saccharomonospora piscinae TaxID=687388 RepID=A0A1V9A9W8_SACPI|nr:hypothetical protein [Saccharomonospora piscinae]OQO93922.1 hypothetical protein B1813_05250 [Saccharomonospora piscinae]TLW95093.1 hypothetical protein FFT09_04390 [Saccharomonospora piscinae]